MVFAIIPTLPAAASGLVTASLKVVSRWTNGHSVRVTIRNDTGNEIPKWTMVFDAPAANRISQASGADVTRSGLRYTAVGQASFGPIAPHGSRSWSYSSSGDFRKPRYCQINGSPCGAAFVAPVPSASNRLIGYFPSWSVYARDYHVKDIDKTGTAGKLTDLIYGFGDVVDGQCAIGDAWADYQKPYSADMSVDGVADSTDPGTIKGNIGQLRKLKSKYPSLKILWSIGGWTYSTRFPQAASNPDAFADSCYRMLKDPRWSEVFDGIDMDWEFPNACGVICDSSGQDAFPNLMASLRRRFGASAVVTAAITEDGRPGRTMDTSDYFAASQQVDFLTIMSYGYTGTWMTNGPTGLHSPLYSYPGIPYPGFYTDAAVQHLKSKGVPANKILIGVSFYGRGWTGVTQTEPGGTATGLAAGSHSPGISSYGVLSLTCPTTATLAGSAYAKCGDNWWSYDNPATVLGKMAYVKSQGLGGAFIWEIAGDNPAGDMVSAMRQGLSS